MRLWKFLYRKLKAKVNGIRNEKLRQNILQALPFWVGSGLTGLAAVYYAKLFSLAESVTSYIVRLNAWWMFIITPACFLAAKLVVRRWSSFARGSGIPQVMAAIELATPRYNEKVNKLLSLRIIVVKIFSSIIFVIGGGIIGREGPTIQVAGSIFRKINQMLPARWPKISKRNMIMTGAAAGLAAAFNTPLGGIVFAVEELTKTHISYFKTALFTAVIIAGLTAQALAGPYLYLGYPDMVGLSSSILLWVVILAIVAGLCGSGMSKVMLLLIRWKAGFKKNWMHVVYITVCALLVVFLATFVSSSMYGSGKELMTASLFGTQKHVSWYIPLLRIAGPVFSFTTGAAGGVFAPSLSAGAMMGSAMSGWLHFGTANTNLLILAGMVAFLTGVTRTPFTSAILVLEMTDRHNVIFHLMLAGLVANMVSLLIDKHSFYDHLRYQYVREILHDEVKAETIPAAGEKTNT